MTEEKILSSERIAASFKELALVSPLVEAAAADLAESISKLESYLRRIHIQVSAWHKIAGHDDEWGYYWTRDIGWTRIKNTWRIAIRKTEGSHQQDEHEEEIWPFSDAPKWMCVEAVGQLPDLFEALIKRTKETTEKLKARKKDADDLAAAIGAILPETTRQVNALKKESK